MSRISALLGALLAVDGAAAFGVSGGAPRRAAVARSRGPLMQSDGGGEGGLTDLFSASLKQQKKEDAAAKKEQQRKVRPGPRLDLENRPQNFFRGLAERDERLAEMPDLERAELMSDDDKKIWLGGFALIALVVGANVAYGSYEEQAYRTAFDEGNTALVRCLDTAFSFSEKNICRMKY